MRHPATQLDRPHNALERERGRTPRIVGTRAYFGRGRTPRGRGWRSASEAVSEGLHPCHSAVLEPDTLHQPVGTKIVGPDVNLTVCARAGYVSWVSAIHHCSPDGARAVVYLGRSAAFGGDFNLTDSLVDDFVVTHYRLPSSQRRDNGQGGACESF
jgi:hypothetical protein